MCEDLKTAASSASQRIFFIVKVTCIFDTIEQMKKKYIKHIGKKFSFLLKKSFLDVSFFIDGENSTKFAKEVAKTVQTPQLV